MSEIDINELKKQLKNGDIGNFYVFYGAEGYLRERYLTQLRSAVLEQEDDPFNCRRFDGRGMSADELSQAIDAFPSFAERSYVEVRDYDIFKAAAAETEQLELMLANVPDYCCLVLVYDVVEYKPDKRKKLYGIINKNAQTVDFRAQEQGALIKWVEKHFEHYGKRISHENAKYMIFLCGELMDGLNNEISKVALYASADEVTREDIDAAASPTVDAVAYELTNELSARNYDKAAEVMGKLFRLSEEPIALLALIGSQVRRLYCARVVRDAGGNAVRIKEELGLRTDYQARLLYGNCTAFSLSWYRRILRLCAETDMKIKSSGADPEELLIMLFLVMAGGEYAENT